MNDQEIRALQIELSKLRAEVADLRAAVTGSESRAAAFGRNRGSMWGVLLDELTADGTADVAVKRRGSGGSWETLFTLEDVLACPLMPSGYCLPVNSWVRVTWFDVDQDYFITAASTCPQECSTDSSSSGA